MATKTFNAPNISCGHCVMTIERELSQLAGVSSVEADAESKDVTVAWDAPATEDSVRSLLAEINYPAA
jgi:copper chaperone